MPMKATLKLITTFNESKYINLFNVILVYFSSIKAVNSTFILVAQNSYMIYFQYQNADRFVSLLILASYERTTCITTWNTTDTTP